jgi:integrase
MASIHQVKKSKYWHVAFTDHTGKRTLKSTKEITRSQALKKAAAMEFIAKESRRADTDRKFLMRLVDVAMRDLGHYERSEPCLSDFLSEWLSNTKSSVSGSTWLRYELTVRLFTETVGYRKLTAVNSKDIVRFRDRLLSEGRSASTVNLMTIQILRIPFNDALKQGLITTNPAASLKPIKAQKTTRGIFSEEQIQQLLDSKISDDWRGMILMGAFTGQRLGDLANLTWTSVDLSTKVIRLEQRKRGKAVVIPLVNTALLEWFAAAQGRAGAGNSVFPTLAGKPMSNLSAEFTSIMDRAGIKKELIQYRNGKSSRSIRSLSFHSLRHSFISAVANAGVNAETRQALAGHSSLAVHKGYTHLSQETLRSAISKLG